MTSRLARYDSPRMLTQKRTPEPRHGERSDPGALAAALGFRRVEAVRIVTGPDGPVAEAVGVVHRYPRTVRIPMAAATRLVAAGAPLRVVRS